MSANNGGTSPISVTKLTKFYGHLKAVDQVSFTVERGEIVGFLGPNGAGKSTVMKILTCYMSATEGVVNVAGHNVYRDALAVRRKVGYQPENVPLYEEMLVYDYLRFMAKMRGVAAKHREERIQFVVDTCGLKPVVGRLIGELSKGYRQRVGLAQALIHDPDVLILDEPMSGLDPNQIIEIRDLIKTIGKEKTVIFSSHILHEIEMLCDRVLIINEGRIVADGTIPELTSRIKGNRRYRLTVQLGNGTEGEAVKQALEQVASRVQRVSSGSEGAVIFEATTKEDRDIRPKLSELMKAHEWDVLELREVTLSLEDVFRVLTGKEKSSTPKP